MKINWSEETATKVISNSAILIIAIAFYFIALNLGVIFDAVGEIFRILTPFIIGFVIAYLLARPVNILEAFLNKYLFRKARKQHSINRTISIITVVILVLLLLALFMYSLIPQIIDSITTLAKNMDGYIKTLNLFINKISASLKLESGLIREIIGSSQELFLKLSEYIANQLPRVLDLSVSLGSGISNFFIGFIISIYMLSGKERFCAQLQKLLYSIFPKKLVSRSIDICRYTNNTFGKYLSGQILDSIILGLLCFILMSLFGMEYALLISLIITITNFIPFIGPIIGAVPSAFLLLMISPVKALWFVVLIIVLQQIDGNLLAPRIVGKTIGLSAFWVVFAIILGGGLFGIPGVLLGVPAFSVIYAFVKKLVEGTLATKGMPSKTSDYMKSE